MKKILVLILVGVLSLSILAGCTAENGDKDIVEDDGIVEVDPEKEVSLEEIHQAVKEEYGEDYIPDMEILPEDLENMTGLDESHIESYIAELPMINVHVDTFIAIQAKAGKADEVEKALEEYRRSLVEDSMQYPMNIGKVNASKIVRHGDYVFFLMLGKIENREEVSEEEALEFAEAEVKRAVDVVDSFF